MSFKEILKKLTIVLMILYSISNLSITSKIEFNKLDAEQLLRETYKPLETFATEVKPTENNKFF